jgi:SAM-dependent methyltransferase
MTGRHAADAQDGWVVRFAPLVRAGGRVLDLACGSGRHTRLFHGLGHPVTAVDRDGTALAALAADGIETVAADLEDGSPWPLAAQRFAGIVVVNYLHRPLLRAILDTLECGGVLIYRTFATGNERFGRPSNPAFLLRPGELLDAVAGRLTVIAYEHGTVEEPRPAVVQRLCAVNDPPAAPPRVLPGGSG